MKIVRVEIIPSIMLREDPEWRHALTRPEGETDVQGFILKLISNDGLIGLGYNHSSAHYGVSFGGIQAALELYKDCLIGEDPFNTEKIFRRMNSLLRENHEALATVDLALFDLQAKVLGLPLYALMGGLVREEIPIIRILSLKEPDQMATNAIKLVDQGYSYIKVKLNGDPIKDLARIKEIRRAVGDAVHLTVDANQTYSPKVAIDTLKRLGEYGIELCEQPVRADDWQGLALVTQSVDCLIEAHESAQTLEDVFGLVKNHIADGINLTIQHLGGLRIGKIAAEICKSGDVSCRVGATGSRLLAAASMHLVASTKNFSYACELGEFSRLLNDPCDGLEVKEGKLKVPSAPGIGVSLRS